MGGQIFKLQGQWRGEKFWGMTFYYCRIADGSMSIQPTNVVCMMDEYDEEEKVTRSGRRVTDRFQVVSEVVVLDDVLEDRLSARPLPFLQRLQGFHHHLFIPLMTRRPDHSFLYLPILRHVLKQQWMRKENHRSITTTIAIGAG